jgi:hypothetical protein
MLLKMGWKEGAGLGKIEDGKTEHTKVKQREEGVGMSLPPEPRPVRHGTLTLLCCLLASSATPCQVSNEADGFIAWTVHKNSFDAILS